MAWIKQRIAPDARVYFDDAPMRYYTDTAWADRSISRAGLMAEMHAHQMPYDYFVLHVKHKHPEAKLALLAHSLARMLTLVLI